MPFLGNTPAEGYKTIAKQDLTGTGATVYTLDYKVTTAADLEVFVNNVRQEPGVAYTVSGDQITFTTALESGDDCYVVFQGRAVTSNLIESQNIADGAVTAAKLDDSYEPAITRSSSDPSTTVNPLLGDLHINTTSGEVYVCTDATTDANVWKNLGDGTGSVVPNYNVDYLAVAGGGAGGGNAHGAGGGAGGLVYTTNHLISQGQTYTFTVGAGGAGDTNKGNDGSNTTVFGTTSLGGGGGGYEGSGDSHNGNSGGSGGGGAYSASARASGTSGQGNAGGFSNTSSPSWPGSGGGGAGQQGQDAPSNTVGGNGGDGLSIDISGSATYYAGGGGGSAYGGYTPGSGGLGGGGKGTSTSSSSGQNASVNTGGGGGGTDIRPTGQSGGNGGSGVVILRMSTANYSGTTTGSPTVTTDGLNTILTFTSSGSYTA